jgi:hypothetical protein
MSATTGTGKCHLIVPALACIQLVDLGNAKVKGSCSASGINDTLHAIAMLKELPKLIALQQHMPV